MPTETISFCRICAAACGVVVRTDGDRVLAVRGDRDHPVSRGYTCPKGRALPGWHHSPGRLDRPRLHGTDAPWGDVLDDLAARVRTTIDTIGPDGVALYLATGLAYDSAGQVAAAQWLGGISSRSFVTAVTVDNAPVLVAAEMISGQPMLNPVFDPTAPGLLLLFGTNPVVSHGYGTAMPDPVRHLRDYRGRGGSVVVLDPRRTETATLADRYLAIRPGSDTALLATIVRAVLHDGPDPEEAAATDGIDALARAVDRFTPAVAAGAAGVTTAAVEQLVAEVLGHRGRLAIHCGTGLTMSRDGVLAEWLRWAALILSGSFDRPGGMRANRGTVGRLRPVPPGADPAHTDLDRSHRVVGQLPVVTLLDEIEAGRVRTLVVTGGNPLTAFPDPDRVRAALRSLDALAVVDVAESELTGHATHVLPATGQLERADVTLAEMTALRSGLQYTAAVVAAAADRRPVWWILAQLDRRLGVERLGGMDPDLLTDELFLLGLLGHSGLDPGAVVAAGPHGVDVPVEYGWVRDQVVAGGRWQLAPPELVDRLQVHEPPRDDGLVLTPHRAMAWSNSVAFGDGQADTVAGTTVTMSATTAAAAGLGADDDCVVRSEHGEIVLPVVLDDRVADGVITVRHGTAPGVGSLTSGRVDVDRITAMPRTSGVPVTLGPATPADGS